MRLRLRSRSPGWWSGGGVVPEALDGLLLLRSSSSSQPPASAAKARTSASSAARSTATARGRRFSSSAKSGNRNDYDGGGGGGRSIRSYDRHYIDGRWTEPRSSSSEKIGVVDPSSGRVVATVPRGTREDTLAAIEAARRAKPGWSRGTSPRERTDHLRLFLERFRSPERIDEIVDRLTAELGCTRAFARNVQATAPIYHAQTLLDLLDDDDDDGGAFAWEEAAGRCTVVREPVGVVGAITPWNYPLNQIALKVVPALAAGCTVVLKPSEVTPLVAYSFAEALEEAGLPDGVFNMVVGTGPECGQVLAEHPDVDLVSFTGSTEAGGILAKAASGTMKALRTELGGKSAALLLDDADLERVVPAFVRQLTSNTGQSCNALSRMIVPRRFQDAVLALAARTMSDEVVGDPSEEGTTLGPLASEIQRDRVVSYIRKGIEEGATLVVGGPDPPPTTTGLDHDDDGDGSCYVVPTLFGDVTGDMTIANEEIFGPVLCVLPYDTEDEAVRLANGTRYGLNAAVASRDAKRALKVASKLESGMVMINGTSVDFLAPFGGYKQSGNAREWGLAGLHEYLVTKTVNVPLREYRSLVYGDDKNDG